MVSKQAEEWQLQSELREQMQGYKRMRHQHKHQVGGWVGEEGGGMEGDGGRAGGIELMALFFISKNTDATT